MAKLNPNFLKRRKFTFIIGLILSVIVAFIPIIKEIIDTSQLVIASDSLLIFIIGFLSTSLIALGFEIIETKVEVNKDTTIRNSINDCLLRLNDAQIREKESFSSTLNDYLVWWRNKFESVDYDHKEIWRRLLEIYWEEELRDQSSQQVATNISIYTRI